MTPSQIKNLKNNQIQGIYCNIGKYGKAVILKVFKNNNKIVVVNRDGLLQYLGNAEYSFYSGVKNKHYKIFNNNQLASNFILSEVSKYNF